MQTNIARILALGTLLTIAAAAQNIAVAQDSAAPNLLYRLSATATLPGGPPDWDYIRLDQDTGRLFIARSDDGLAVYDINAASAVATVPNSTGANGPLTLTEFNRGYVAMTDGTALIFNLETLEEIRRIKLDGEAMNGAIYDPASKRVIVGTARRPEQSTWYLLDPGAGKLVGTRNFDSKKMDDPVADGRGAIFAPMRDKNVVLKLRSKDLAEQNRYTLGSCEQPAAVEYRADVARLLVACRGEKPVLQVLDPADGRIIASLKIGHGVDGMVLDEERQRIITSNGADATLTVISYDGADAYRILGNVGTQPFARTMQIDKKTGRLFLVTADYTIPAAADDAGEPAFHPGTFRILTYMPQ